jgi:glycerol-3-phosphate dehydrogenase (NAD(P)+)
MNISSQRVGIIGSGSWATAIAKMLLENINTINWYFRKPETVSLFKQFGHNPRYLRGVGFDTGKIRFHTDINALIDDSEILVLAVPSVFLPLLFSTLTTDISGKMILSGIKGTITDKNLLVVEYLNSYYRVPYDAVGVIAGPCHSEEVALERLSYLTIACPDEHKAEFFTRLIQSDYIITHTSDDIWGTEYTSVIKNIIAIAAGIVHGLHFGDNFQAVLISNAIQEIKRFVDAVHPITRDIKSSAYLGDLLVTAYSQFSRNRLFGTMIGKGYSIKTAQMEMQMIAEGYYGARSIHEINKTYQVDMPVSESVYRILYENEPPVQEIDKLAAKLS